MSLNSSSLFSRLVDGEVVVPHLEKSLTADMWPDSYSIEVDSSPYYGSGDGKFHPSSHAFMPVRKLYYTMLGITNTERKSLTSAMTLAAGSAFHAIVQTQLLNAGLIAESDIEHPANSKRHNGTGRIDFLFPTKDKTYVVDLKTTNPRVFNMLRAPKQEWVGQVNCYMDWKGLDEGVVVVLELAYPFRMREFRIRRDEKLLSEIYGRWDYVMECIEKGNPPPMKCCALNSKEMQVCPAREICLETY